MRTLIVIIIGLVLALAFVYGASYLGKDRMNGLYIFAAVWLVACAVDLYVGVRAGYGAMEELGIHTVIFAIPAVAAFLVARYL